MTVLLVGVLDEPVPGDGSGGLPQPGEMWDGRVVSDTGVTRDGQTGCDIFSWLGWVLVAGV